MARLKRRWIGTRGLAARGFAVAAGSATRFTRAHRPAWSATPPRARRLGIGCLLLSLLAAAALAGCGGGGSGLGETPRLGQKGTDTTAAQQPAAPDVVTKNTTRVGGGDAVADAAAVAKAVYPSGTRPPAVVLADGADWAPALAASVLMSEPLRAPLLLTDGTDLPPATARELSSLKPTGAPDADGAQVIRIGDTARPEGLHAVSITGDGAPALAAEIVRFHDAAAAKPSSAVLVVSLDDPAYAMPAAGWAAKSGTPILFVKGDEIPDETTAALRSLPGPRIYVLGPPDVVSDKVVGQLGHFGQVTRISGRDPVANAIAFARFGDDRGFGWHVVDPGHGLVFANASRPLDASVAAPLSASGSYGPLLLVDKASPLPAAVEQYLLDIQPGYSDDPVRGVYNHGWLIGGPDALSVADQSRIDSLLEIAPVKTTGK